jgi:hypothetical protein
MLKGLARPCVYRRDHEARGHRDPHRLSGQPPDRACGRDRHPPDHRAPGAHRPAHGRRHQPRHLGPHHRRLLHAARPGRRERLWRRRAGYGESGPGPGHAHGLSAAHRACRPELQLHLQMRGITKSAEPITSAAEVPNIMRRAFTRCATAAAGPCWSRSRPTCGTRRCRSRWTTRPSSPRATARTRPMVAAARCWRREAPVIYAGQGVHWAEAWPQLRARRAARRAGRRASAARAPSPRTIRCRWARVASRSRPGAAFPRQCRRHPRHRLLLHRDQFRREDAGAEEDHPRDARPRPPQQGRALRDRPGRRCGLTLDALLAELAPREAPRDHATPVAAEIGRRTAPSGSRSGCRS